MSEKIQYEPSLSNIFLAIARGEHLQTITCPHCTSKDVKPTDDTYTEYECTECGTTFEA